MQGWIENPEGLKEFLKGLNHLSAFGVNKPLSEDDHLIFDFGVKVDRSLVSTYPEWVAKVGDRMKGVTGFDEYNLDSGVGQWTTVEQKMGKNIKGADLHTQIRKEFGNRQPLPNIQDALAIKMKGIRVFRQLFRSKCVFFWGTICEDSDGELQIPYLQSEKGEVVLKRRSLRQGRWHKNDPMLIFFK